MRRLEAWLMAMFLHTYSCMMPLAVTGYVPINNSFDDIKIVEQITEEKIIGAAAPLSYAASSIEDTNLHSISEEKPVAITIMEEPVPEITVEITLIPTCTPTNTPTPTSTPTVTPQPTATNTPIPTVTKEPTVNATSTPAPAYSGSYFKRMGVINEYGYRWTWYSETVLPGRGLHIPGRHLDESNYVCDENDYICLASCDLAEGTIIDTPFGKKGKIYDYCEISGTIDVYVHW